MGSADYKDPYWPIGMGIKRTQIEAKLVPQSGLKHLILKKFEPLQNFEPWLENFETCFEPL